MTRAIRARSSSTLASFSIIDATMSTSYGERPTRLWAVLMPTLLATRVICCTMRDTICGSVSLPPTWYVSGKSRPSRLVTPGASCARI